MKTVGVIATNHIRSSPIIERSLYKGDITLKQHIERLCNPRNEITYDELLNLCIKYIFSHRHCELANQKIPLIDIERFMSLGAKYFSLHRKGIKEIELKVLGISRDVAYFQNHLYGVSMLGDISASVEIFKSIIEETIDPEISDKKYFGLDLGTGTGWLLLAQYIQARRNGFQDIRNWGVEINEQMTKTTMQLMALISPENRIKGELGKVLHGNTVLDKTVYEYLTGILDDRVLTYISNENIPTMNSDVSGENDPFFQNIIALDGYFHGRITEQTSGFPKEMTFRMHLTETGSTSFQGDLHSRFCLPEILKFNKEVFPESDMSRLEKIMNIEAFKFISPHAISIGGSMVPLSNIGKHLEADKKVFFPKGWRRRWYGKEIK